MQRFAEIVKQWMGIVLRLSRWVRQPDVLARCIMERFGTDLMLMFLAKAWPSFGNGPKEYASWDEVTRLFFENATHFRNEAERTGRVWSLSAVEELDLKLMEIAESGQFTGRVSVSPEAAEELWRRWKYAIIGSELENVRGPALMLPLPLDAPDELKGMALMLYVLGGPARNYRKEMFSNE